jgi:hypothetical protein
MLDRRYEINRIDSDNDSIERLVITVTSGREIADEKELKQLLTEEAMYKGKALLKAVRESKSWIVDLSKNRDRGMMLTYDQAMKIRDDFQYLVGEVSKSGFGIAHVLVTPFQCAEYIAVYLGGEYDETCNEEVLAMRHNEKYKLEGFNVFVLLDPSSGMGIYQSLKEMLDELGLPEIDYDTYGVPPR